MPQENVSSMREQFLSGPLTLEPKYSWIASLVCH